MNWVLCSCSALFVGLTCSSNCFVFLCGVFRKVENMKSFNFRCEIYSAYPAHKFFTKISIHQLPSYVMCFSLSCIFGSIIAQRIDSCLSSAGGRDLQNKPARCFVSTRARISPTLVSSWAVFTGGGRCGAARLE